MAEPAKRSDDLIGGQSAQDELRLSAERFRLLVQSVKDYAIILLDPDGQVVTWNEGAEHIKGYAAEEIVGRSFSIFHPPEAIAAETFQCQLDLAKREGRVENENWRLRKDGSRFWANVVISAVRSTDGRLLGFATVTRDLTARREAEQQALQDAKRLKAANAELQAALADIRAARDAAERSAAAATEAYRELDQFAYVASHDLKAPLRGIANLAQWIQDDLEEHLDADSVEHMRLLQGRVHRMEALIDGILAYSRAGRTLAAPEPVEIGALVREVKELLAPPPDVTIQLPERFPTLEAERVPLQQVFMNLIDNAVKYASRSRPDAVIRLEWNDIGDAFEFAIIDNGPGIAPEYHDRIWGIFQTLAARDKVEGTGIGLSLVRKIVETRGGRISLESAPNRGATFRFVWPKSNRQGTPR